MAICRSDFVETVKSAITMQDAALTYGFEPNRSGYILCPIHGEKTPSLKLYENGRGWYCFGCGIGGDVINFVRHIFNLDFRQALLKLNNDFSLGLPIGRPRRRAEVSKTVRDAWEKERQRKINREYELILFAYECGITSKINQCEITMAEHPPIRQGWEADYPVEWVKALKEKEKFEMELYNVECEQRRHREAVNHS